MKVMIRRWILALAMGQLGASMAMGEESRTATRNVVLVTTDGLRWQEVFRGADASLLNKPDGGVADVDALRREFWRETPEARREALMPFLWSIVARQGQIFGNADKGSPAQGHQRQEFLLPRLQRAVHRRRPTRGSTATTRRPTPT